MQTILSAMALVLSLIVAQSICETSMKSCNCFLN